jgi:predicted hotdog family 3-hydroxylacyl-ACP dehydratase
VAIEYAAQAMALHGALNAKPGVQGRPGFLASARGVRCTCRGWTTWPAT